MIFYECFKLRHFKQPLSLNSAPLTTRSIRLDSAGRFDRNNRNIKSEDIVCGVNIIIFVPATIIAHLLPFSQVAKLPKSKQIIYRICYNGSKGGDSNV